MSRSGAGAWRFGWPEDTEEFAGPVIVGGEEGEERGQGGGPTLPCLTPVDRVVVTALRSLDVTL